MSNSEHFHIHNTCACAFCEEWIFDSCLINVCCSVCYSTYM